MRDFQKMGDGSLALIMSYIPGPTWEQVVSKGGKMDPEDVAWITQRALNALKYLHFHGVVHGDVKPQNTIVQPESHTIVLVDFGLSMVKPTKDAKARGYTPVFASPEQLRGDPLVPESDLYSLGMTMLYALSGDIQAVERFDVPSSVPKELCDFIQRLIVRDVRGRPNWKEDLIETLRKLRLKVFGRDQSGLKPLRGFKS
jgi:serine/threonine protein kinase